ncbi:MAG: magnesium transporter CorA family protein [Acidobacteria bacterium]|nr:magnesium transporter CorA family protein [Acidobacteriota bacterium]
MSITLICHSAEGGVRGAGTGELASLLELKGNTIWLDADRSEKNLRELLRRHFKFHPVAIEDCLGDIQRPKIEAYGDHLLLALPLIAETHQEGRCFRIIDVAFFWGPNFVVSARSGEIGKLAELQGRIELEPEIIARGADFLMERLLHGLVEESAPCVQDLQRRLEGMEERTFSGGSREDFSALFQIRKDVVDLRHVFQAEEEVFGRLARNEFPQVCKDCLPYLRDLHDHYYRLNVAAERFQLWVAALFSAHQARLSEKTNEVMKLLTAIATTLLPLGVVTGFFGMNFLSLPGLRHPLGWLFALAGMALMAGGMLWAFRRKGWL